MEIFQIAKILFGQEEIEIKDYPFGGDVAQLGQKNFTQFTKNDWQSIRQLIFVLLQEKEKGKLQLLHDILEEKKSQLDEESLKDILLIIKLEIFEFLDESQQAEFLKNYFVAALRHNLDVKQILSRALDYYYDQFSEDILREKFSQAIADNQEDFFGLPHQKEISLKGKELIKDYLSFSPTKERGSLEEIDYLNRGEKFKNLAPSDRELVLEFLNIYDWLRFPKVGEYFSPYLEKYFLHASIGGKKRTPLSKNRLEESPVNFLEYLNKNHPTLSQFASYLKSQFPAPTDFKKVLKILNELKRQGYPQYLGIIYFDAADSQFKWKY